MSAPDPQPDPQPAPQPVLEIENVSRRFGAILANDAISMTLGRGEIVALLGENGAGKTTLMSILFGLYTPDTGRILIEGRELPPGQPRAAIRAGVGMVHQHFSLAPNLTVLENVMTGTESLWSPRLRAGAARARLLGIAQRFGLRVDPDARLGELSVGEQQRVEILKALYNDARILILDEPTAVLTNHEAAHLFVTLREMARQGLSLIFISHKLDEVMAAADRIVVLRGGRVVAERRAAATGKAELAELMVGRRVVRPRREAATPGAVVLELRGVSLREGGVDRLSGIGLSLRAGEVLGIIGVAGNGQTHLARILSGTVRRSGGEMTLFGRPAGHPGVAALVAAGIGRIPEDRHKEGVIGEMAVWENMVLEQIDAPRFARLGVVDRRAGTALASRIIAEFDVRGARPGTRTQLLSGGNMQKLILGRNLQRAPRILLAAQPARGLDEGAVAAVHARILAARRAGTAVLLISEDLDEVMALSDRVQAMVRGRLSPSVDADRVDARALGLMMAGDWTAAQETGAGDTPERGGGTVPGTGVEARPEVDAGGDPNATPETGPGAGPETDPDAGAAADPDGSSEVGGGPASKAALGPDPQATSARSGAVGAGRPAEAGVRHGPESGTRTRPATDPETDPDAGAPTGPDGGSDVGAGPASKAAFGPDPQATSVHSGVAGAGQPPEAGARRDSDSGSGRWTGSGTDAPAPGVAPETPDAP